MDDGAEMGGIADEEVVVHIVQRTFDLPSMEDLSESRGDNGECKNVPGRLYFHLRSSIVGALSTWRQGPRPDQ